MNYENVEQFNQMFIRGQVTSLPEFIYITDIEYRLHDSVSFPVPDMLNKGYKTFVVYSSTGKGKSHPTYNDLKSSNTLNDWVVMIWAITKRLSILPARIKTTTGGRGSSDLLTGEHSLREDRNIIPDVVEVKFNHFNKSIQGKIDTGAHLSSLHVENWEITNNKLVKFHCSLLSNNTIQMNLIDQVSVQTADGENIRPVIELDITINNKLVPKAKFNLNNRSHMESKLLIGQNILEKGNFLIDPGQTKDHFEQEDNEDITVDWEYLQEEFKDIEANDPLDDLLSAVEKIY